MLQSLWCFLSESRKRAEESLHADRNLEMREVSILPSKGMQN